jgi:DNA polymerase-3 subunit gamma/tau
MTAEDTQLFYQMALNGKRDITLATDPRSGFEMILLRMVAFRPAAVIDESLTPGDLAPAGPAAKETVAGEVDDTVKKPVRAPATAPPEPIAQIPAPPSQETVRAAPQKPVKPAPVQPPMQAGAPPASLPAEQPTGGCQLQDTPPAAGPGPVATARDKSDQAYMLEQLKPADWHGLLEQLGLGGIVYTIANNSELRSCAGDTLQFVLDQANAALFNHRHVEQVQAALEKYFGTALVVTIEPGATEGETPARRQARLQQERQQAAVASIEADPLLQKLIARFDGELDRASITPVDP